MNSLGSIIDNSTVKIRKIAQIWSLVIIAIAVIIFVAEIIEAWMNPKLSSTYPW